MPNFLRALMRVQIVIPARLASTRLPEKLLLQVGGKSVLQHTYESASRSHVSQGVIVAVDDPRLAQEVDSFGGDVRLTSPSCQSGTDRVAEIAAEMTDVDIFVNVQGDEPEIDPTAIDRVAQLLIDHPEADMATVAKPIRDPELLLNPNCVKVIMGDAGRAIYFSRAAVPYARDGNTASLLEAEPPLYWHHVGLYAYRREFLLWFAAQRPSTLELTEKLEQLRAIQAGRQIVVARVETAAAGIDTLEDFKAFTSRWAERPS
jgi:3-deoxy-manno-octulosonate cytidylyltransferase (CMP-KDO synthetase)